MPEENTIEKKKLKKSQTHKTLSARIPNEYDQQLQIIANGSKDQPGNKSAVVERIIEDFFKQRKFINSLMSLDDDSTLVPVKHFLEAYDLTHNALNKLIAKGELTTISLVGDYVAINEDNMKNIFAKFNYLKEMVGNQNKELLEISKSNANLVEKLNELENLKVQQNKLEQQLKQLTNK